MWPLDGAQSSGGRAADAAPPPPPPPPSHKRKWRRLCGVCSAGSAGQMMLASALGVAMGAAVKMSVAAGDREEVSGGGGG